jgi:hypothetical protein
VRGEERRLAEGLQKGVWVSGQQQAGQGVRGRGRALTDRFH